MSIRSKALLAASMALRPEHKKFVGNLHPQYIKKLERTTAPLAPLKYKIHPAIEKLSYAYPHPAPLKPLEVLPFEVERTSTGNLPVYVEYNANHNIKRTIIRKINGDVDAFCEELQKVVSNYEIRKKIGYIEIPGVHKESVFHWLIRLGFWSEFKLI